MKSRFLPVVAVAVVLTGGISAAYTILKPKEKLRIFRPSDVNPKLVDASLTGNNAPHRVGDFSFYNQLGETVTQKNLEGKIYVADFFFTTCPSICPKMATQMQRVFERFKANEQVMLVSHTVMPEVDSVPVLAEYAKKYGADGGKWLFLTGDKKHLYEMARKSYFAAPGEGSGDEHDFIHTENFVLVDAKRRIRGYYDGTSTEDVTRLMKEIEMLLEEE